MPKGYVIFDEKINDQAAYDAYVAKAVPTIMPFGGKAIVFQNGPEVIEGKLGSTIVILEFPSVDKAREWYNCPDYQAIVGERHAAADCNAAILPEMVMPGN